MAKQRILSVDVLRGLTIAAMIIVNNPAVWGNAYAPLEHAAWHGMTPTDLVFPFFMFITGVSATFSLGGRQNEDGRRTVLHIFKRSALIFLIGALLQLFGDVVFGSLSFGEFRIWGVLQAIAVSYFFGSLLLIALKFRKLPLAAGIILGVWWLAQVLWNGFEMSTENFIYIVDNALIGESHMYRDWLPDGSGEMAFDPESLMTNIPRVAQFLLGAYVGGLLKRQDEAPVKLNMVLLAGAAMLLTGFIIQYGCPINKKVWTSSYALVSSGFAALMLGIFYWVIDIRDRKSWTGFFRVFGMNSIFLYVVASVLGSLLGIYIEGLGMGINEFFYYKALEPVFGVKLGCLVYSLVLVGLVWLVGYILDRRKIYIKV